MKAYISSRKFHPGHFSHLNASYLMLHDLGFEPSLYINSGFNEMANQLKKINLFSQFIADKDFKYLFVLFPSFRSIIDMIYVSVFRKNLVIVYFFHEPYDSFSSYLKSGFSVYKTIKISLFAIFNFFLVILSSKVILPSTNALNKYNQKYYWLKKSHIRIPLLFSDELMGQVNSFSQRSFISYIGTIASDHAFDEFASFVSQAVKQNSFPELQFLIATRSAIPNCTLKILEEAIVSGRLVIYSGQPLTNEKINHCYHSSIVVWNAYKRSMQSGVMPKAFMFGTPVLISSLNQSEFFTNHECGEIITDYNYEIIFIAISSIVEKFSYYSMCCRDSFLRQYFYKIHSQVFLNFISSPNESFV